MEKLAFLRIEWRLELPMVKYLFFLALVSTQCLSAITVTVHVSPGDVLNWNDYSGLGAGDTLNIVLSDPSGEVQLLASGSIVIEDTIQCNGHLRITSQQQSITQDGTLTAPEIILEAARITLTKSSVTDASSASGGGSIYIGGGWLGMDPSIKNAQHVSAVDGSQILADALVDGSGGTVVLWSEKITGFEGLISAQGKGLSGDGGAVEISSYRFLIFDGSVDVSAQNGHDGTLSLDPYSITIQAANPDIDGNGTNMDITMVNELDDATTTPVGFPNASSIITAGALSSLLTNNVSLTLAAQSFITLDAPLAPAGTNVTLTFSAPTINLNQPITLASGGSMVGVGVATVNVGPSGNVQNAVDFANNGVTVNLSSATYLGPVDILNKDITLSGNGAANTTILNPPGGVPSHSSRNPIVFVQGGTDVTIQNLTVDGAFIGFPINANITGVLYLNAGGTISNAHVTRMANSAPPYGGGQQGNGIRAVVNAGGPFTFNITGTTIDLFQKAGIVASGSPLTVNITNNNVIGLGVTSTPAANGIQISSGATGVVSGNTVSGIQFTDHHTSTGILTFSAGSNLVISGNTVNNNDEGILSTDTGNGLIIQNNLITNSGDAGIAVLDNFGTTQMNMNTLTNNGGLGGVTGANTGIYLFSSSNEAFEVNQNTITPAVGASGMFTQGNALGQAPNPNFFDNVFLDP